MRWILELARIPPQHRRLVALIGVMFVMVLLLLGVTYGALSVDSAMRAYVGGESLWSKGQKDAVYYLSRYIETQDPQQWRMFEKSIATPLSDRRARLAMNGGNLDWQAAYSGLEGGGNHPADIPSMIRLYRWFYWEPHVARAISTWKAGDAYIVQLRELGRTARDNIRAGRLSPARRQALLQRLDSIDTELRPLEDRFSRVLGEAARWLQHLLFWVLLGVAVAILFFGTWTVYLITARVFEAERRFRATFEHAGHGIAHVGLDGTWIRVNPRLCEMLGYRREELLGMRFDELTHPEDREPTADAIGQLLSGQTDRMELTKRYVRSDGQIIWVNVTTTLLRDIHNKPQYLIKLIDDITEEKRLSDEIFYRARHDQLTGLINRYEFEQRLRKATERVRLERTRSALCYLDLDQFKIVNDTCGHMAGDALLQQLGPLIRSCVRSNDTVARLGGDEFGILLEACPLEVARRTAEKIRRAIAEFRFFWFERSFGLGVSIGIVEFGGDLTPQSLDPQKLMSLADTACYEAKASGRNHIHVVDVKTGEVSIRRTEMEWTARLQNALDEDRLLLVWQPIYPLGGNAGPPRHFETLVRLRTPEGDLVAPGKFLPAAERYGQVQVLDRRVLSLALAWLENNQQAWPQLDWLSVNLSGTTIGRPEDTRRLLESIAAANVDPARLCFEITETAAIGNLSTALDFMTEASQLGCRFALDDFGSGVSSFGYLNTLPADYVKIDGMFVRDMDESPVHEAMVRSINEIALAMGKCTIAECVESRSVAERLGELGIRYGQGYALGRPTEIGKIPQP